jgi:gentisate 1,2-dioxygenase
MATQTATISETNAPARTSAQDPNEELIENALKVHTKPLWTQMAKLNPAAPNPTTIPHIWRYDEVRPSLLRAGEIVPESQAERRVLMLVNPARG